MQRIPQELWFEQTLMYFRFSQARDLRLLPCKYIKLQTRILRFSTALWKCSMTWVACTCKKNTAICLLFKWNIVFSAPMLLRTNATFCTNFFLIVAQSISFTNIVKLLHLQYRLRISTGYSAVHLHPYCLCMEGLFIATCYSHDCSLKYIIFLHSKIYL